MLAGLAPARRRLVLAVVALGAAALVVLGTLVFTRSSGSAVRTTSASQLRPGPVLLVPGYGGSTGSLHSLADRLTAAGRDATVVSLPGDGTGDLAASAKALGTAVTEALTRSGDPSVDLVG